MIPRMLVTDLGIRKAKPQEKPYERHDKLGLFVLVKPGGPKLWRQKYEHQGRGVFQSKVRSD